MTSPTSPPRPGRVSVAELSDRARIGDLVRRYARAAGRSGRVVEVPLPGAYGRSMRDGTLLPRPEAELGVQTFEAWLAAVPARV